MSTNSYQKETKCKKKQTRDKVISPHYLLTISLKSILTVNKILSVNTKTF